VRAAAEMGIVPGGGAMLASLVDMEPEVAKLAADDDERLGVGIVFKSLAAPLMQIGKNAGIDGAVALSKCVGKPFGFGYNAATDVYEDLLLAGVLDPAKVTINAVENSCSVASLVLTTEAMVVEIPEDVKDTAAKNDADAGMDGNDYQYY
jgi:chaperonin GroEL